MSAAVLVECWHLLGELTSSIWARGYFIEEDRVIECETETDTICRREIFIRNFECFRVGRLSDISDSYNKKKNIKHTCLASWQALSGAFKIS